MVIIKHNSLKSDIHFNPIFVSCLSGSRFFRVWVQCPVQVLEVALQGTTEYLWWMPLTISRYTKYFLKVTFASPFENKQKNEHFENHRFFDGTYLNSHSNFIPIEKTSFRQNEIILVLVFTEVNVQSQFCGPFSWFKDVTYAFLQEPVYFIWD